MLPVLDGPRDLVAQLPHARAALRRDGRTTQAGGLRLEQDPDVVDVLELGRASGP